MVNVNTRRNPAVYALHAGDHNYFYVGVTAKNSDNRLYEHIYRARSGHQSPVYQKMRELGTESIKVVDLRALEVHDDGPTLEAAWIKRLIELGYPIVNEKSRDGVPDSVSPNSRARTGAANKGRPTWIKGKTGEAAGWTEKRRVDFSKRAEEKRKSRAPRHGTVTEYRSHGCRCAACFAAARHPKPVASEHGRYLYKRDKCRCTVCVTANREYLRSWVGAKKSEIDRANL